MPGPAGHVPEKFGGEVVKGAVDVAHLGAGLGPVERCPNDRVEAIEEVERFIRNDERARRR